MADGLSPRRSPFVDRTTDLALLFLFAVAAVMVAIPTRFELNPDAAIYLRLAGYWRDGQWDLATTGHWGPLLPVLMAPLRWLFEDVALVSRAAMAASAVLFLAASLKLFHSYGLGIETRILCVLAMTPTVLYWSVSTITPDLLMGGLFLAALAKVLRPGHQGAGQSPVLSGVLFGLAYLAKPVALPMSVAVVAVVQVLRLVSGELSWRAGTRHGLLVAAAGAVVIAPWIAAQSLHYGTFTFTRSGGTAHDLVGPGRYSFHRFGLRHRLIHPAFESHHRVPAGRMTAVEDSDQFEIPSWSPFESMQSFKHQLRLMADNAWAIASMVSGFGIAGLSLPVLVLAFFAFGGPRRGFPEQGWRWGLPCVLTMCAMYIPVYSGPERYYWVSYPLIVGSVIGFTTVAMQRLVVRSSRRRAVARMAALGVIGAVAFTYMLPYQPYLWWAITVPRSFTELNAAREFAGFLARDEACAGGIAGIGDERVSLISALLSERQYLGARRDDYDIAQLGDLRAGYLVVSPWQRRRASPDDDPALRPVTRNVFGPDRDPLIWPEIYQIASRGCR